MKKQLILTFISLIFSQALWAWGSAEDERVFPHQTSYADQLQAVAIKVSRKNLIPVMDGEYYQVVGTHLGESMKSYLQRHIVQGSFPQELGSSAFNFDVVVKNEKAFSTIFPMFPNIKSMAKIDIPVCSKEPGIKRSFLGELAIGVCSGFLVSERYLMTAGHCVHFGDLKDYVWIFGYTGQPLIHKSRIYKTTGIRRDFDEIKDDKSNYGISRDYGLSRLDRPVKVGGKNLTPLKVRSKGKVEDNASLIVAGYPLGISMKVHEGGSVVTNSLPRIFEINSQVNKMNSGSPIMSLDRKGELVVEGVVSTIPLRSKMKDYLFASNRETVGNNLEYDRGCVRVHSPNISDTFFEGEIGKIRGVGIMRMPEFIQQLKERGAKIPGVID